MNRLSTNIKNALEYLDFQFNQADYSSVHFVSDLDSAENLHPKIILDLDRAKMFEADAVYFRFFDANRLPQPQIYIYDNTIKSNEPDYFARIHRNIWSASEISIFMVVEKSSIKVYDSRIPVTIKNNILSSKPIETINIDDISEYNQALKLYNAKLFDNGGFWESDEANKHFLNNKTAYEKLITGLKSVRNSFQSQSNLSPELSDHILILSVLVKYLEENGIDESNVNLAHQFFLESVGYSSFVEIIRNNKLVNLFEKLAIHFNGGIFQLSTSQNEELLSANFEPLTSFLEGILVDQNQLVFWEEYSFKHIPIELISNFYEELLPKIKTKKAEKEKKKDTGAVYTPGFLVNFLVDECLPLTVADLNENVKLIDVSCGSGIFLVTAYKRLVQRWRIANKKNGKLADASPAILQQILQKNIFGVDIDKNAAELTTFSLNLSLCSMLTPKQIWTELRFDDLNKNGNVIQKDFFDYLAENKPNNFDLVIGNPPFKSLGDEEYNRIERLMRENDLSLSCKIPDKQFALMFLDKAMDLLKPNALLCLIMPAGPLLYNDTLAFRSTFFEKYNIPQIIDFTFLRNTLFEHANVAVASVFVQKRIPDEADILHITLKRTRANKEKNYFEIDHYDFHDVPKLVSKTIDFVWKSNLVGGGRIYHLIDKFTDKSIGTLQGFLEKKKNENQWDFGQGYKVGNKKNFDNENIITGRRTVIDKFFKEGIGIGKTEVQNETHFETIPKARLIFEPPHLLIKKSIGKKLIPLEFRRDYLTFRNEVIGVHCPENDVTELEKLTANIKKNNQFYRFYICATSARSGISRSIYTSLTEDFFNLPYPENDLSFSLSDCVLIEDTVNYFIPFFELGENAEISKIISDHKVFNDFSEIYCQALNSIYKESNKQYSLSKVYEGNAFYACEYIFGDKTSTPEYRNTEADFSDLINHWSSRNALIKRVLRIYSDNKIILVKPKQLRYWLKSIALRDVDETLNESFDFNA